MYAGIKIFILRQRNESNYGGLNLYANIFIMLLNIKYNYKVTYILFSQKKT